MKNTHKQDWTSYCFFMPTQIRHYPMKIRIPNLSAFLLACIVVGQVHAVDLTDLSNAPQEIRPLRNKILPDESPALERAFGLQSGENLRLLNSRVTPDGRKISRHVQTYRDLPVWGKQLIITRNGAGTISRLRGTLIREIASDIGQPNPGIGRNVMVKNLRAKVASGFISDLPIFEREKAELVIYIDDQENARLAYKVEFLADIDGGGEPTRPIFVVDANNGEVLESYDALAHQSVDDNCSVECTLLSLTELSGSAGKGRKADPWDYYQITIPTDVVAGSTLTISLSGGSGDADLYTRLGAKPSTNQYDCRPYLSGNNESCTHTVNVGEETWHIGLYAYSNYSGVSLTVSVKAPVVVEEFGQGSGGNEKIGLYYYDHNFPALTLEQGANNNCVMNNAHVKTVDLNHETSGSDPFVYGNWDDGCYNDHKVINRAYSPLNDAHYFGQVVFDMYKEWLNTAPLSFQLTMRVHYSNNYENAFWDGSSMTFGDGATTFHPLVSLDVSAHEVSHGFTEKHSKLIYSGQSGGINEAFSDMSGEAAEFFMTGEADFEVGADIFKGNGALRYMAEPPSDGSSIDHVDHFTTTMDVHYSSGVFNKAFYELAVTQDWGVEKAFKVFAWANMNCWIPDTTFQQGAECVLNEATAAHTDPTADSPTYGEYDPNNVAAAFAVVGITLYLPEAPADITLTVSTYKVKGVNHAELAWTPDGEVNVYVDDSLQDNNADDNSSPYTYKSGLKGGMTRLFKVCSANDTCSEDIEVTW